VIKNRLYRIYFTRCMNIFNSLLAQLVKYDVHTTHKINLIHAIFYHILSLSVSVLCAIGHRMHSKNDLHLYTLWSLAVALWQLTAAQSRER